MLKIRKGDEVIITIGKDRGRHGTVEKVLGEKVLVPGVNVFKKHVKPQGQNRAGGIIDIVKPVRLANIALVCPNCSKQTRVGFVISDKGDKQRICRKCKKTI